MKRIISNIEIARAVIESLEEAGFHPVGVLEDIDIGRSPEEEENPVNDNIIDDYIAGFLAQYEAQED